MRPAKTVVMIGASGNAWCAASRGGTAVVSHARDGLREPSRGATPVAITDAEHIPHEMAPDVVALSDALSALASFDPRMSQVVELRFFGGLTVQETADVLNVSPETVMRDWKTAKAWLLRELSLSSSPPREQH